MKNYKHGGQIYVAARQKGVSIHKILDFSANINPLVTAEQLASWAKPYWQEVLHYPDIDYFAIKQCLADYHGIEKKHFVVGNGATALIEALIKLLSPKVVRVSAPTFGEYEKNAHDYGATVQRIPVKTDLSIDLEAMFSALELVDLVFLCTPNNPTGLMLDKQALLRYIDKAPLTTTFIIDEAFIEFTEIGENASLIPLLSSYDNVIVLRSATKFYGIPGLRLGYVVLGNATKAQLLAQSIGIWHVNVLACGITIEALKNSDFQEKTRVYIKNQRRYLSEQLQKLGLEVYPSKTNYILMYYYGKKNLQSILYQHHILIRNCDNYYGLGDGYFRIAVKDKKSNDILIDKIKDIVRGE